MKNLCSYIKKFNEFNLPKYKYSAITFCNKLGEGATGSVYKCFVYGKLVTIKIFDIINYLDISSFVDDVYNEMYISNLLKKAIYSINIIGYSIYNRLKDVKIYLIYDNHNKSIDMREFISNKYNKSKYILSNKDKLSIIQQFIYGLKEIKEKRITHCDIKLENIIIYKENNQYKIKYIDFGGSCYMENDMYDSSEYDYNFGTEGYMPIEAYNKKIYFSSDIYALAICILEVLIGKIWDKGADYTNCRKEVKTSLNNINNKKIKNYLIKCLSENYKIRPNIYDFEDALINHLRQELVVN